MKTVFLPFKRVFRDFPQTVNRILWFLTCVKIYKKRNLSSRFPITPKNFNLQLNDRDKIQTFDAHYIYHPAWAIRIILAEKPEKHIDISSTLWFSAALSAMIPVDFFDYRQVNLHLTKLTSNQADLTALFFPDNTIKSLSCMHVLEHVGLGRYGETIDPDGDRKAARELSRVLAPGGILLLVVPVGKERLCFNAHRIYSPKSVPALFPDLHLNSFSYVDDNAKFHEEEALQNAEQENYACGCFFFRKLHKEVLK